MKGDIDSADKLPAPGGDQVLAASAAAIDQAAGAAGAPAAAPGAKVPAIAEPIDFKQEARDLWKILAMLSIRYKSLERVYTDQVVEHLATAWAPVLERHNLDMGRMTIYFVAGTATLPILGDTYKAIQHDRAIERQAKPAAPPGPTAAPAAAAEAVSGGIHDPHQLHKKA